VSSERRTVNGRGERIQNTGDRRQYFVYSGTSRRAKEANR
jgi:hypothetical protein